MNIKNQPFKPKEITEKCVPGETVEDIAKIDGYFVSPSRGVHSTFKILPTSSRFGQ